MDKNIVVIRGGGDLASGVAACLYEAGFGVVVTELAQPLVVRRAVSFAEAVYEGTCTVEGITGRLVNDAGQADALVSGREIAVLVDPECACVESLNPIAIVDARMLKRDIPNTFDDSHPLIGLGPGFNGGVNCWVAIETNRGAELGKIFETGSPEPDTGLPASRMGFSRERVLYAFREGVFKTFLKIGDQVDAGQKVAEIEGELVISQIRGVVRGLLRDGLKVSSGVKVGDIDPSGDPAVCYQISDKARKIGEAVVKAVRSIETAG